MVRLTLNALRTSGVLAAVVWAAGCVHPPDARRTSDYLRQSPPRVLLVSPVGQAGDQDELAAESAAAKLEEWKELVILRPPPAQPRAKTYVEGMQEGWSETKDALKRLPFSLLTHKSPLADRLAKALADARERKADMLVTPRSRMYGDSLGRGAEVELLFYDAASGELIMRYGATSRGIGSSERIVMRAVIEAADRALARLRVGF